MLRHQQHHGKRDHGAVGRRCQQYYRFGARRLDQREAGVVRAERAW
jgi:hypothetical protein